MFSSATVTSSPWPRCSPASQLAADEELNGIRSDFHALVQNLGPGYTFSVHFVRRRVEPLILETDPSAPEIIRYLRERQTGFWERRSSTMYENRVFISLEAETGGLKDTLWGALVHGKRGFNWPRFETSLGRIGNVWHGILDNMAGFARVRPLGQDEMLRLFYYFLNPLQRIAARQIAYNPGYTIPEQILDANWANGGEDLCREDNGTAGPHTQFRVLNLETLPAVSYPTLFDPLTRLGSSRQDERLSEYWITQHYEALDPEQFITALNIQQNWGNSLANVKALKSIAQKSIDLASDAAEVTNAIQRDKEGAGYFSMFCVVYDRDRARLEGTANRILTEARAKNAKFLVESPLLASRPSSPAFRGTAGSTSASSSTTAKPRSSTPTSRTWPCSTRTTRGIRRGRWSSRRPRAGSSRYHPLLQADDLMECLRGGHHGGRQELPHEPPARQQPELQAHRLHPGCGQLLRPARADRAGLREGLGGLLQSRPQAQPLRLSAGSQQAERVTLTHLIEHLITGGQAQLSQGDRVDLMDALAKTLEEYEPADPPTLEDYYRALDGLRPELAKPLRLWITGGPYAAFFCHKQDTFQNADLVYFELTGFDDHPDVGSAITYMLFTKIFQRLQRQDEDRKKIIVLDECWKFLMNDTMASKIKELYRTIRKHNGSIQTITQHPNDLINSPHRDAILANTSFLFMLEQKGVGTEARDAFGLNPREAFRHAAGADEEGPVQRAVLQGPYKRQVRVLADPYSYVLYTTDPDGRSSALSSRRSTAAFRRPWTL